MNTMKMKNTNQYKKSWEGGGNCGHKIFTCWVEEGDILKTISYVELFMDTMKMKDNFCNGCQYKKQKSQDEGGNNAYKIFISRVEEGNIPNTISYPELFMTTMKMKINYCNECQYEMQKYWDGGGSNAHKIFMSQVEEGIIPNAISYVKLLMTTMKMINFCSGHQYEMCWRRE